MNIENLFTPDIHYYIGLESRKISDGGHRSNFTHVKLKLHEFDFRWQLKSKLP